MTPELLARMEALKAKREPLGMNVHFLTEDGRPDVWSFNSVERANAFRENLRRNGRTILEG